MIKHFSIQPNEESLNTFLDSHQPEEIGYPRIDLIEENGEPKLKYKTVPLPHDYSKDYLTIETISGETEVAFYLNEAFTGITNISYSLDRGNTWTTITNSSTGITEISLDKPHDKILFKGIRGEGNYTKSNSDEPLGVIFPFINTGRGTCKVYGNIMSLQEGDDFIDCTELNSASEFKYLFSPSNNGYGDNTIVDASNLVLPATTLEDNCYQGMFYECTSLITAPELPATTLAENCYWNMFYGCTSLTTAPILPATALTNYCYAGMFQGCTSLTVAPELPATALANYCYNHMFYGCTALTTTPELPATTLANHCYYYMFYGCTSLTTAPELPATVLTDYCYQYMFDGCTSLNYVKAMILSGVNTYTNGPTYRWLAGVASTGTFVKNSAATWNVAGFSGIPTEWTVETASE